MTKKEVSYDVNDIKVLEGLEHVRLRPGMYIGGADKYGFHHLLEEILNNSIDEAINGYANEIVVCLDDSLKKISVDDNGRGIPTDIHPDKGISTVELVLTSLHSGGKFGDGGYKKSGGLHGVGSSVVNALSSYLYVKVQRSGGVFEQEFERGKPKYSLRNIGNSKKTGTFVEFIPDIEIFGDIDFDTDQIKQVLEAKSYLHSGIKFIFRLKNNEIVYYSTNGLFELVSNITKSNKAEIIHGNPISFLTKNAGNDVEIDMSFCWTDDTNNIVKCYANGIYNSFGGTHEAGFKDGVIRSIRSYMTKHDISIKGIKITPDDMREGLYFVISVFLTDPEFQAQTKDKLLNSYIKNLVSNFVYEKLENYLLTNPDAANLIITRIIQAAKARSASRAASDKVSRKKTSKDLVVLPGKLADCQSTDISENELILVEGECFKGDTLINTDKGLVKISDIKDGDMIYTHMHRYRPAKVLLPKVKKKKCRISIQGKEFVCSEDHLFLVFYPQDNSTQWIEAKYLTRDHLIVKTAIPNNKEIEKINIYDLVEFK